LSCLLLVVLAAAGCRTGTEQWGPFRGQVVDAETGAPIAGANVMVLWIREPPALHFAQQFYDAQETVTDAAGRFDIPRETHVFTAFVNAPAISAFAPGYEMAASDGITIRMRPLKTPSERCEREPYGIGGVFPKNRVPEYSGAIDRYVSALRCADWRQR
jgi:hypothetical protein